MRPSCPLARKLCHSHRAQHRDHRNKPTANQNNPKEPKEQTRLPQAHNPLPGRRHLLPCRHRLHKLPRLGKAGRGNRLLQLIPSLPQKKKGKNPLRLINCAFSESFQTLSDFKKKTNFKRCLKRPDRSDVRNALQPANQIMNALEPIISFGYPLAITNLCPTRSE